MLVVKSNVTVENHFRHKYMFLLFFKGTPLLRTPIRKRQFNTPVFNTDAMPCTSATRSKPAIRTLIHSATTENPDLANPCISLTKEFEAVSSPAKVSRSLGEQHEQQKPVKPRETTCVQQNQNIATPLRVPSSIPFIPADNNKFSSPAMLEHCQNSLSEQSKCVPRKATPHPKVCWTDTPVKVELSPPQKTQNTLHNATPMRESIDLNLSGIQVLGESPTNKDQQKTSSEQVFRAFMVNKYCC